MKIGIIGLGTVGKTIYKVMSLFHEEVFGYDSNNLVSRNTIDEVLKSEVIFLALPTPTNKYGRLDSSLIIKYLDLLRSKKYSGMIIIKSTLPLGFFKTGRKYRLRILYSPEFLHEKTALADFLDPKIIVCSGSEEDFIEYITILYWIYPTNKFYKVGDRTAEITKLAMNAFAATKISFVNEVERICKLNGADCEMVMELLRKDGRCSPEYSYPNKGPYSGKCLEKDTSELRHSTPNTFLLEGVIKTNELTKKKREYQA